MENLARYVACLRRKAWRRGRQVQASFSQERMTYLPDESQVLYRSKDGKNEKTFDALEWLAAMPACACRTQTGVPMFPPKAGKPNKGEQMVRYRLKTPSLSKSRTCSPLRSQRTVPARNTSVHRNTLVPNMMCQVYP